MKEDRQAIWQSYVEQGGEPHSIVRHMFTNYNRYHEANLIGRWFVENKIKLDFPILDYGCGVGDYGIQLIRNGATDVSFYDFPRATNFVNYRLEEEGLKGNIIDADHKKVLLEDYQLIIFGEVLEHIDNPYQVLIEASQAKYIFTSSYPYRSDDPDDPYWSNHDHGDKARILMPKCRELLENNYTYEKFDGELRLWIRT